MKRLLDLAGRFLLRVLPAEFRGRYGEDVADYFSQRTRETSRTKGWAGVVAFWIRGSGDVIRTAIAERRDARGRAESIRGHPARKRHAFMSTLLQDIKYAVRTLRRAPMFTLVAIFTLALGIGANVAVFSTAYSALLKPLPFVEPERLVIGRTGSDGYVSGPDYVDFRDRSNAFENLGAILPFAMEHTITGGAEPERVAGTAVSVNLFPTLGVAPLIGRGFADAEGQVDAPDVALISHGYWQRRFGGSAGAVGAVLTIDGAPFTVVGVMPRGFRFFSDVEFWRPMRPDRDIANLRDRHNWYLVGRLAPGVTIDQARTQADVIFAQLEAAYPETNQGKTLSLTELHTVLVADYRTRLFVLAGAVGLVLLIACGNVAGMLLARAPARRVELSMRAALGASAARLVRQMLAETVVLSAFGGMLGVACAVWMQRVILDYLHMDVPGIGGARLSMPMLGVALAVSLVVGLLAGIYPALNGARGNLADDLKAGARTTVGAGTGFRSGLVVGQVALSIVLLIGSGLLIRSFLGVRAIDPGFSASNLLTAETELAGARYSESSERIRFYSNLLDEARSIPGVLSAGLINNLPIRSPRNIFHAFVPDEPESDRSVFLRAVMPGYFETMRIRLLSGRDFEDGDAAGASPVFVINSAAARTFFGDASPVGQQLGLDFFGRAQRGEIVGVVDDVRMTGLHVEPGAAVYLPYPQSAYRRMQIAVRTSGEPATVATALRTAVRKLDRDVPVSGIATMEALINDSMAERRTIAYSLTLYAALPLLLAAVGLYAVLAYYVGQRFREIGVRLALGAEGREIATMILRRGTSLIVLGLALGLAGAVALTRLIRQLLFGIEPTDLPTFVGVSLFVLVVALVACLIPAWRATRVDPIVALQA